MQNEFLLVKTVLSKVQFIFQQIHVPVSANGRMVRIQLVREDKSNFHKILTEKAGDCLRKEEWKGGSQESEVGSRESAVYINYEVTPKTESKI